MSTETHSSGIIREALKLIQENFKGRFIEFPLLMPVIPGLIYDPKLEALLEYAMLHQNETGKPASWLKIGVQNSMNNNNIAGIESLCIQTNYDTHASVISILKPDRNGMVHGLAYRKAGELFIDVREAAPAVISVYEHCLQQIQNRSQPTPSGI